jgi:hypothetical protein
MPRRLFDRYSAIAANPIAALWVFDPLEEFLRFDRYKHAPAHALSTKWAAVRGCFSESVWARHSSKVTTAAGSHYTGSTQLKALPDGLG